MPTVVCPGCQKQYKLPETAAGQVASCKCGKRFRVGGGPSSAPGKDHSAPRNSEPVAKAASHAPRSPKSVVAQKPAAATSLPSTSRDDDWDALLSDPIASEPQETVEAPVPKAKRPRQRFLGLAKFFGGGDVRVGRLYLSIVTDSIDRMSYLDSHGFDLKAQDKPSGRTALMFAADKGQDDAVRFLLDLGCDPYVLSSSGETALSLVDAKIAAGAPGTYVRIRDALVARMNRGR